MGLDASHPDFEAKQRSLISTFAFLSGFYYLDSIVVILVLFKISMFHLVGVAEQIGLSHTRSGFLVSRPISMIILELDDSMTFASNRVSTRIFSYLKEVTQALASLYAQTNIHATHEDVVRCQVACCGFDNCNYPKRWVTATCLSVSLSLSLSLLMVNIKPRMYLGVVLCMKKLHFVCRNCRKEN